MGRLRHWKQRWNPDAEFVFLRRMKLGLDPKRPVALPGDPVPKGDARLGRGRLKRWWDAGFIGLADWRDPAELRREAQAEQDAAALAERIAELRAELEALAASKDADPAAVEAAEASLAELEAIEAAGGVAGLQKIEAILTAAMSPAEPVEREITEPSPGPVVEVTGTGFEVSLPTGELASVSSIEEAATFIRTGELPPESPSAAPEGGGDADAAAGAPAPDAAGGAQEGASDEIVVEPTGGGWFAVTVPGEAEPRKVQGEAKLQELLAELGADPTA